MTVRKPSIPANVFSRLTKVFITNLPEKCSDNDLAEFIRPYGVIYDLYIAHSRDLLRQICNTRIGDCWLKANIARFTLEEGDIRPEGKNQNRNNDKDNRKEERQAPFQASAFNGSRSFSDMLTGRQSVKTVIIDNQVNEYKGLHGKVVVARMIDLEALKSIYLIMNELCPGGRQTLLK
ncbi:putative RNA recognition motif domain, RNA-binding domain superfamily [Helianthus anomalus]